MCFLIVATHVRLFFYPLLFDNNLKRHKRLLFRIFFLAFDWISLVTQTSKVTMSECRNVCKWNWRGNHAKEKIKRKTRKGRQEDMQSLHRLVEANKVTAYENLPPFYAQGGGYLTESQNNTANMPIPYIVPDGGWCDGGLKSDGCSAQNSSLCARIARLLLCEWISTWNDQIFAWKHSSHH